MALPFIYLSSALTTVSPNVHCDPTESSIALKPVVQSWMKRCQELLDAIFVSNGDTLELIRIAKEMKEVNARLSVLSLATGAFPCLIELHGFYDKKNYPRTYFNCWPQSATLITVYNACLGQLYSRTDARETVRTSTTSKKCLRVLTDTPITKTKSKISNEDAQKGAENAANLIAYGRLCCRFHKKKNNGKTYKARDLTNSNTPRGTYVEPPNVKSEDDCTTFESVENHVKDIRTLSDFFRSSVSSLMIQETALVSRLLPADDKFTERVERFLREELSKDKSDNPKLLIPMNNEYMITAL
jgi:hypothetical protein